MSNTDNQSLPSSASANKRHKPFFESVLIRQFSRFVDAISIGRITLEWPDGRIANFGDESATEDMSATVVLHNFKPVQRLLLEGQIGLAESYLRGEWSSDNLVKLFYVVMLNENEIDAQSTGWSLSRLMNVMLHKIKRNNRKGSQRNIAYHYDLGNAFYQLWLDSSMNYSSALYQSPTDSLAQAQQNKLNAIVDMLNAPDGATVLEIGCGWGSLAQRLAEQSRNQVTAISLSAEQLSYAREANRWPESVNYLHQDYREVNQQFDHIVSIEMFEAVGEAYWQTYFSKVSELLNKGGSAVLQVITLLESQFDTYKQSPDFIQRYIFPGGMLPTKTHLKQLAQNNGLELVETQWFGQSYAQTLAHWREQFEKTLPNVRSLGFDERFIRMWRYYLAYCEVGFSMGNTDVGLLKIRKTNA